MKRPTVFQKQLQKLTRLSGGDHPIVSCYLKLEPRDRSGGKYRIKVKNRIRDAEAGLDRLDLTRAEQDAVRHDLNRIQAHLERVSNLPGAQGIALFASRGHRLFEAVPLPRVHRSRLSVDRSPMIGELAALEDEFGTFLTVVLDRTGATIWEVNAYGATRIDSLTGREVRGGRFHGDRGDAPGVGEHGYHGRIRADRQRLHAALAERLFHLDKDRSVRGLVLGAPGGEAGAVLPFLHPYLAGKLIGTVKLTPKEATAQAVHAATLSACEAHERQEERNWVAELGEKSGTGWAVNGVAATLRALGQGKVRTLLVRPDAQAPGFRGARTARLALQEREVRLDGGAVPVLDVIDDAIEEALRQRVTVDVIYDSQSAQRVDGLAALLRFR